MPLKFRIIPLNRKVFITLEVLAVLTLILGHSYITSHYDGPIARAVINALHGCLFGCVLGNQLFHFTKRAIQRGWIEAVAPWEKVERKLYEWEVEAGEFLRQRDREKAGQRKVLSVVATICGPEERVDRGSLARDRLDHGGGTSV